MLTPVTRKIFLVNSLFNPTFYIYLETVCLKYQRIASYSVDKVAASTAQSPVLCPRCLQSSVTPRYIICPLYVQIIIKIFLSSVHLGPVNPRFEKSPVMVPVTHPYFGKFNFEVFPDLLVDNPSRDGLYGEGAVLVTELRSHQDLR